MTVFPGDWEVAAVCDGLEVVVPGDFGTVVVSGDFEVDDVAGVL